MLCKETVLFAFFFYDIIETLGFLKFNYHRFSCSDFKSISFFVDAPASFLGPNRGLSSNKCLHTVKSRSGLLAH
jgi:hypothetical protein